MDVTSERPHHARRPHTEYHADQILPSIEQSSGSHHARNSIQQRRIEDQNASLNRLNSYAEQDDSSNPSARVPVNPNSTEIAKKHGLEGGRMYPSPYNHGEAAVGTVLIPLEEYHQRHRRQAQATVAGQNHTLGLPSAEGNSGSLHCTTKGSSLRSSPIIPAYTGHIWSPQRSMQAPTGQHQRPPHLQVQLHSGTPSVVGVQRSSSHAFHIPQSDSLTSPTSRLDRTVAPGASGRPFLTRTSGVSMNSDFRERDSTGNVMVYAPTAVSVEQDPFELRRRASYTNHNSVTNDSSNPFQERNISHYSFSRPGPAIGVTDPWERPINTQEPHLESPQYLLDTRPVAHSTPQHPFLPLRSRQTVFRPSEQSLPSHDTPGKPPITPSYQPRDILRYVTCRLFLTYPSGIVWRLLVDY